jgi:hypothetical protein
MTTATSIFARLRDWVEPAHPGVIKQYEAIVALYKAIRERLQPQIDEAFDNVSKQIGYVVATTVPVTVRVGPKNNVEGIEVGGAELKGTLFEEAIGRATAPLMGDVLAGVDPGHYTIYVIWHAALKLKLRKDWMEPAHVFDQLIRNELGAAATTRAPVGPGVREPAHFLDPGIRLKIEDVVLISAIDEVYPDIRLGERIAGERLALSARAVSPHVQEPAHFRASSLLQDEAFVAELGQLIQRFVR